MKIKPLIVFLAVANFSFGQPGHYFLSQYTPSDERINYIAFGIAQDSKGVIYFANKSGVLEFDGRNWNLISTPGPIFTIVSLGAEVFAGGYRGFGKLVIGQDNSKTYQSLSQSQTDADQIFSSVSSKDKIYFANAHTVFAFSPASDKIDRIKSKDNEEFGGLLDITGNIYVKSSSGLLKVENNQLVPPAFPWLDRLTVEFSTSLASQNVSLLGVSGGRLFLASTSGLREINPTDHEMIVHNAPVSAAWINENLVAIGTLRGGVIFINPQTGATQEVTNFYTGLPDNEVFALLADRNQGLWVSHDYGFTRIAPYLPFKSYSHYPGLEGNLLCAKTFKGQTYVGTTIGLFTLDRKEIYEDVVSIQTTTKKTSETKSKKGLFSFLRRNKPELIQNNKAAKHVFKSISHQFKKIEGIDGKVTQLLESNDQLLAAGTFGLFSVSEKKATPISQAPMRSVYETKALGQLLASTLEDEIKSFAKGIKGWQESHLLDTLDEYVSYIFEDKLQNIWLCGRMSAIKVETVDGAITAVENVPFANPAIDESVGIAYGSDVYMVTGGSFHRYDIKNNVFKKYDSLPETKKYFASAGYFWFHDGHRWRTVDPRMEAALKLEWLSLFSNIRFIAQAEKENLWIITANNELYKFSSGQAAQDQISYPLFLREVHSLQNRFAPSRSVKVSQLESTISFEFIQPDYLGMRAVEYRYRVKGLNNDWTTWASTNNIVNFSYLPTGKYKVDVQTRDLVGKITNADQITFEVEPPYWQQSWFYLVEVIFFGSMVYLSMRLSSGNTKYRLLSQLLSLLTVIMLIQFIQTMVSSQLTKINSPVIEFFVQVAIALLVLPVENYLRKFMLREEQVSK
jgi:hypothetical protein